MRARIWLGGWLVFPMFLSVFACGGGEPEPEEAVAGVSGEAEAAAEMVEKMEDEKIVPVEGMVVRQQVIEQSVPLIGLLQAGRQVEIVAEVQGKVEALSAELGEEVTVRDTLARIDERIPLSQYRQARAQVLSAKNGLAIARLNFKSDGELFASGDISRLAYDNSGLAVKAAEAQVQAGLAQLSAAEKQYLDTRITAPINGLIARRHVEVGTMVSPGMPLFRVVDLSVVKVEVGVPQALIGRVRPGDSARVVVSALGGRSFDGIVRFISPQAEPTTGAFGVEVHVENSADLSLRAGMTVQVEMAFSDRMERLAIPEHAMVSRNGDRYAYEIEGDVARLRRILVDEVMGGQVVVAEGLAEGDTIVVVGMKNLGVETRVRVETIH
jgi:RND family efflux transporter MFP subunit